MVLGDDRSQTLNFCDVVNSGAIEQGGGFGHTVSIGGFDGNTIAVTADRGPGTVFRVQTEAIAVAIIDGDIAAAMVIDDRTVVTVDRSVPGVMGIVTVP